MKAEDGMSNENRSPAAARLSDMRGDAAPAPEPVLDTSMSKVVCSESSPSEASTVSVWTPSPDGVPEKDTVFSARSYAYALPSAESGT